jgi:predicted Zn finger-like uncharacterized protein
MKFVCDRCQTKYSIADDKVRGKVLKVRCKTCQNVITVREAGAKPSVGSLEPIRPSQRPSSGALATLGEAHEDPSERTNISAAPAGLMADLMQGGKRATPPPPPSIGRNADGIEWFLALEGAQQGPFPRKALVDRLLALPKDSDVHVWNESMDGWKPPADVPEVARDLEARKPPAPPIKARTTPAPPLPAASVPPPPVVPPPAARRGTMPLTSGLGAKLNLPTPHVAAAHAVPAPHAEPAAAKAPVPVGGVAAAAAASPALAKATHASSPASPVKKNGVGTNGTHAAAPAAPLAGGGSDPLSALNIDVATPAAAPAVTKATPAPPRLMDMGAATAWSGSDRAEEGRQRNTKVLLLGAIGVVAAVVVVIAMSMTKKAPTVAATAPIKAGIDSEALGKLHDELSAQNSAAPSQPVAREPAPEPAKGKGLRGRNNLARGRQMPVVARGNALAGTTQVATQTTTPAAPVDQSNGFKERAVTAPAPTANRPPPSQGEITRVINNNKIGIKTCYQRALLRDSSLTHGKIVVGVTIGISGRVKHVKVDGPSSFRSLEPCIREMVGRWTFPQASEEYGTEFSYLFQGNE